MAEIYAPLGGTIVTTIGISSDQMRSNAPNTYTNDLVVTGTIYTSTGLMLVLNSQLVLQPI
jgi:hypothetical protein